MTLGQCEDVVPEGFDVGAVGGDRSNGDAQRVTLVQRGVGYVVGSGSVNRVDDPSGPVVAIDMSETDQAKWRGSQALERWMRIDPIG